MVIGTLQLFNIGYRNLAKKPYRYTSIMYVYTYIFKILYILILVTFVFDEAIRVFSEGDKFNTTIASVDMTFSIPLRFDTLVQFRYENLTANGNSLT